MIQELVLALYCLLPVLTMNQLSSAHDGSNVGLILKPPVFILVIHLFTYSIHEYERTKPLTAI